MPPKITGYQSTPEKDAVRDHFDLPLLQAFSSDKGGKLAYFGLPGEECRDIHAWRDLLSEVAAVERKPGNLRKMREVLTQRFRALRAYPNNPAALKVIRAQAKCRKAM